ncbi:MAG: methionine--tRNA ligase [Candidatus Paceibacterota bacterium]|nr:methionine--tRNA ligase [Candidatus Nomurabacteria bacterium]
MNKPFYITTTLPYVNAKLHMGHALEFVRADAIARYHALVGDDVFFNSGTDEHGSKIYNKAKELGISPQEFVDQNVKDFYDSVKMFGVMEDIHFIRTSDPHHVKAAQEFWKKVSDNGYIYKKNYEAKYCTGCEQEKTDSELVDGFCPEHPGVALEKINEENYFFKFSEFQKPLLELYDSRKDFVIPEFRFNELRRFVEGGLQDFSISRLKTKMPWGIEVPGDESQVMYVWFDALVNYIATVGYPDDMETFEKYWINGTPTQYCGKDNTRFQAAMWQAMLLAAGLPNSYQIVVNGHITAEGGVKMSKSLGNVVDPKEIADEYGSDALRCFLLKEISNFEDSPFTLERFKEAYNANLANGLGNLASRILTLSEKYLDACPPIPEKSIPTEFFDLLSKYDIHGACEMIWHRINALDKRIQETAPFKVVKEDLEKGKELISENVLELYTIARMLNPIMPNTNKVLKELIKANKKPEIPLFLRKD